MTHRFLFRTDSGEVVEFDVSPENIAACSPMQRSALLWSLDANMNREMPVLKPEQLPRYHAWTTQVLACAVSELKHGYKKKLFKQ